MRRAFVWVLVFAGCGDTPGDGECDPDNNAYETAGCTCEQDTDCTCQVFDGAEFQDVAITSACEGGICIECRYL